MVSMSPIWKDPHEEISSMSQAREIRGTKKELIQKRASEKRANEMRLEMKSEIKEPEIKDQAVSVMKVAENLNIHL